MSHDSFTHVSILNSVKVLHESIYLFRPELQKSTYIATVYLLFNASELVDGSTVEVEI